MSETTIEGKQYLINKIPSAIKQMHIARRILPIIGSIKEADDLKSVFDNLGKLDDETFEYVVIGLLEGIQRKESAQAPWSNVVVGGVVAYQDINLIDMLKLAKESAVLNFGYLGNVKDLI